MLQVLWGKHSDCGGYDEGNIKNHGDDVAVEICNPQMGIPPSQTLQMNKNTFAESGEKEAYLKRGRKCYKSCGVNTLTVVTMMRVI